MSYRVIQWATGNLGRLAIEGILAHPELELAGVWVHSASKDGKDAGEICGIEPTGVRATRDIDSLLALGADCVLYSPLFANPSEVARILEAGMNVVTPMGWFFPPQGPSTARIEQACRRGGVTLHGTGIHPGGITERFPLMISALSHNIRHVRAEEFSDIRTYQAEGVVREVMLFGKPPEEASKSPMLKLLGDGFNQSIDMVAEAIGFRLDRQKRTHHEMAIATADIETPVGTLAAGTVAAQRFRWQGLVDQEPVISVGVHWLMGEEHLEPAWNFGPRRERFEIAIDGDPPVEVVFHGLHPEGPGGDLSRNKGMMATAMHCVNAIPAACRAQSGIQTYLDLPLVAGRAAAALAGPRSL